MTAFDEGLVDSTSSRSTEVVEAYEDEEPWQDDPENNWLSVYRDDYSVHAESKGRCTRPAIGKASAQISLPGSIRRR